MGPQLNPFDPEQRPEVVLAVLAETAAEMDLGCSALTDTATRGFIHPAGVSQSVKNVGGVLPPTFLTLSVLLRLR